MQWTEKQQEVIDTRGCNLLVSAAAGSGKTAVLVERIVRLISEGDRPLSIDRLLVMTFTNAAAAEMRERIAAAIGKKLAEHPENDHLQAQAALVPYAQITTIDSFCLNLIREHFNLLDLDPAFRIGEEGEITLLMADVMGKMLEDYYDSGDEVFMRFADTYATGKSDEGIEDYIRQVYEFARSNPFPERWIGRCRSELDRVEEGEIKDTGWMRYLLDDIRLRFEELEEQYGTLVELCKREGGPEIYLPNILNEREHLLHLARAESYDELRRCLELTEFGRLKAARGDRFDPELKEMVTECRNRAKKIVGDMKKTFGALTEEEAARDILMTREVTGKLLELAEEFSRRYQEAKKDKNLVDFGDLEHYALKILIREDGQEDEMCGDGDIFGSLHFTETADELSRYYEEILVDEYQDSNYVQEALIRSLSGERFGRPDVFMVGDVKQSIYKFRLARPEMFMQKYRTYLPGAGTSRRIELQQNFRSRGSVLESVNRIFYQVMTKNMGNVEYTRETALYPGAVFADGPSRAGTPTELMLMDTGRDASVRTDEEESDYTARELEAKMIAGRIHGLTDPKEGLLIWDKEKEEYRTAGFGDIVILLRSMSGWSEVMLQVLTREGIPAYAETGTGYFNTVEVETVLAMLSVIDNPMQDIPLAAVLRSPMVGLSDEEMAWIMAVGKQTAEPREDRGIYGALRYVSSYTGEFPGKDGIVEKLRAFSGLLAELRRQAEFLPIHELICRVYEMTGYYDYVSAMPAGQARKANLDMLAERAAEFEKTSYKGLFSFVRYVNRQKKYQIDFGEAAAGKYENMVRIMSIHKSKGLEFPVVFLAGTGKPFNRQDVRGRLIIDADLGIGTDYLDLNRRTKCATLKKLVLKRKLETESLGEELRILYVAMTRAKEKLIMTGTDKALEKKLEKWKKPLWGEAAGEDAEIPPQIPYTALSGAGSFLDWILMAYAQTGGIIDLQTVKCEEMIRDEAARQFLKKTTREELLAAAGKRETDGPASSMREKLRECFAYRYPYEADVKLQTKTTVSQLKKAGQEEEENGLLQAAEAPWLREPEAPEDKQAVRDAAERGTAYHRVLELLDFAGAGSLSDVEEQMRTLRDTGRITPRAAETVQADVIWRMASSPLGRRMARAQQQGRLHREQQFVIGIAAREMGLGDSDELVLVQGIIDAYIEEEDGLVLIDYKTDRIPPDGEEILVRRYRLQLSYYQKALEQMRKGRVKEKIIYSLRLQKEIRADAE